ncbi:alpha/beta hydrolase [Thermomonas sp. HDW16]|uniref:alpha/beta hydrolase n=1 Tax=Thermomonas sp. HDW16 TaxID=2714945 RepID=UPI00140B40CA|nr:alpha/beta hydrolase [Thermomonas sp. HDW16]QIL20063.1 alpha/beta hydrolase [Thermomonas sp. HDW16]
MRLPTIAIAALVAFATLSTPGHAQQRLRQLLEQRREARATTALPAGTRVEHDIAYGTHPEQRYDVYLPTNAKPGAPILLMVHGGGWRRGDKASPGVVGGKAAHWLAKGYVFVSVDYRLLPDADPLQQAHDVAAAVASVQKRARQWRADPQRLVLMGHSAGAHLVALLGASPSLLLQAGASRPLGVVSLDSAAMNVPELMDKPRLPELYRNAFGTDPRFWAAASPYDQLTRRSLPMLIVCSSQRSDSCPQGRTLADKARNLGVPMQVLPEDLSHGEVNSSLGAPSAHTRAVTAWIDRLAD